LHLSGSICPLSGGESAQGVRKDDAPAETAARWASLCPITSEALTCGWRRVSLEKR